jgi:hypothetical protein
MAENFTSKDFVAPRYPPESHRSPVNSTTKKTRFQACVQVSLVTQKRQLSRNSDANLNFEDPLGPFRSLDGLIAGIALAVLNGVLLPVLA